MVQNVREKNVARPGNRSIPEGPHVNPKINGRIFFQHFAFRESIFSGKVEKTANDVPFKYRLVEVVTFLYSTLHCTANEVFVLYSTLPTLLAVVAVVLVVVLLYRIHFVSCLYYC